MALDAVLASLNRFTTLEVSRKVFIGVTMVGIFVAGYQAWSDEHAEHQATQEKLVKADRKIVLLEKQAEIKITGFKSMRITEEEKMAMAEELQEAGSFSTEIVRLPDADSVSVADFLWILKKAGWTVGTLMVMEDEPMSGIFIFVPYLGDKPAGAEILARVFEKHNIDFTIRPRREQGLGSFTLFIGSRP